MFEVGGSVGLVAGLKVERGHEEIVSQDIEARGESVSFIGRTSGSQDRCQDLMIA